MRVISGSAKGIEGQTRVLGIEVGGGAGKAHIALDIRIIDATTTQIVAAASVEGDATSLGLGGSTVLGGQLPVSLGGFSKTPIEKAIRVCIQEAVNYVVSQTPREYYRH